MNIKKLANKILLEGAISANLRTLTACGVKVSNDGNVYLLSCDDAAIKIVVLDNAFAVATKDDTYTVGVDAIAYTITDLVNDFNTITGTYKYADRFNRNSITDHLASKLGDGFAVLPIDGKNYYITKDSNPAVVTLTLGGYSINYVRPDKPTLIRAMDFDTFVVKDGSVFVDTHTINTNATDVAAASFDTLDDAVAMIKSFLA